MSTGVPGPDVPSSPPLPPSPGLKSFNLTHVRYPAGGPVGPLMALASLAPQFIMCAYATAILSRRELTFVNACVAQLANEGLNWLLKRLLRLPRPAYAAQLGGGGTGYGMPSSHSQFMGFFAAFFLLHLHTHRPYQPRRPITIISVVRRIEHQASQVFVALLSSMTVFSRWYLGYHSIPQVLVGLTLGLLIGGVYWYLTEKLACRPIILPFDTGVRPKYLFKPPPPRTLVRHDSSASATLGYLAMAARARSVSSSSSESVQSLVSAPADVPTPREPSSPAASIASETRAPPTPDERGKFHDPFRSKSRSRQPARHSPSCSPKGSTRDLDIAPVSPTSGANSPVGSLADLLAHGEPPSRRKRPRTRYPFPALRQLVLDHPLAIALRLRDSYHVWHDGGLEAEYGQWRQEYEKRRAWEWDDRDEEDIRPADTPGQPETGPYHHSTHHSYHHVHHSSHTSSRIPSRGPSKPPSRTHSPYPDESRPQSKLGSALHTSSSTATLRESHTHAPGSAYTRALAEKLIYRRNVPSPSFTPPHSRTPEPWVPTLSRRGSIQTATPESTRPARTAATGLFSPTDLARVPVLAETEAEPEEPADEIPAADSNLGATEAQATSSASATATATITTATDTTTATITTPSAFAQMAWTELSREEQETHVSWMLRSLRLADKCGPTTTAFCVGSLVRPRAPATGAALATGFSRELEGNTHAEQCVLDKLATLLPAVPAACAAQPVLDLPCDLYTTMEPCSERLSGAVPCMQRILAFNASPPVVSGSDLARLGAPQARADSTYRLRITRVLQGVSEPDDFVQCVGARTLRDAGVEVLTVAPLEPLSVAPGGQQDYTWLEKECLRVAKFGHPDQPAALQGAEALWKDPH